MAKELNNFERLLEEQANEFPIDQRAETRQRIDHTLTSYKLIGQLVNMYVPTMVNVLIAAAGGNDIDTAPKPSRSWEPPHQKPHDPVDGPRLPDGEEDNIR